MKIIGITGGIGSGKTAVAKFIEAQGYPVYYSDVRAKEIVNDNAELKEKITNLLGENAYDEDGVYNRKWVAEQVFTNEELLLELNKIIHPAVKLDFENWISAQKTDFVFKETALLFELGLDENCHKIILVTAEDNIRIKRVMDRDGKTYREVENIIQKQMPEKEKIERTEYIIYNNEGLEELRASTNKILNLLTQ